MANDSTNKNSGAQERGGLDAYTVLQDVQDVDPSALRAKEEDADDRFAGSEDVLSTGAVALGAALAAGEDRIDGRGAMEGAGRRPNALIGDDLNDSSGAGTAGGVLFASTGTTPVNGAANGFSFNGGADGMKSFPSADPEGGAGFDHALSAQGAQVAQGDPGLGVSPQVSVRGATIIGNASGPAVGRRTDAPEDSGGGDGGNPGGGEDGDTEEPQERDHNDRGHGNNEDGVDDDNPGQGGGGPNDNKEDDGVDEDEGAQGSGENQGGANPGQNASEGNSGNGNAGGNDRIHDDNGHGNNEDGVDDDNPGQGGGGPNALREGDGIDEDEGAQGGGENQGGANPGHDDMPTLLDESHGNGWHDAVDDDNGNGSAGGGNDHTDAGSPLEDMGHAIPAESIPDNQHDHGGEC